MAFPTSPAPDHIEETERKYLIDEQTAEDGTQYRYLRRDKMFRVWRLVWEALSAYDQGLIETWLTSTKYGYTTDTWTNPYTTEVVTVRVKPGSFKCGIVAYPYRKFELSLEEVV